MQPASTNHAVADENRLHIFILLRRHRLNEIVKLYFLETVLFSEDLFQTFSAPKLSPTVAKALTASLMRGRARPGEDEKMLPPR